MTGRHVRAARALLGWTQADLAARAKIGVRTVKRFENDEDTTPVVATAIERAFEDAGLRIFRNASELAKIKDYGVAIVMRDR